MERAASPALAPSGEAPVFSDLTAVPLPRDTEDGALVPVQRDLVYLQRMVERAQESLETALAKCEALSSCREAILSHVRAEADLVSISAECEQGNVELSEAEAERKRITPSRVVAKLLDYYYERLVRARSAGRYDEIGVDEYWMYCPAAVEYCERKIGEFEEIRDGIKSGKYADTNDQTRACDTRLAELRMAQEQRTAKLEESAKEEKVLRQQIQEGEQLLISELDSAENIVRRNHLIRPVIATAAVALVSILAGGGVSFVLVIAGAGTAGCLICRKFDSAKLIEKLAAVEKPLHEEVSRLQKEVGEAITARDVHYMLNKDVLGQLADVQRMVNAE